MVISEVTDLPFMIAAFMFHERVLLTTAMKYFEQLFLRCTGPP
jgi:hypothetical protein